MLKNIGHIRGSDEFLSLLMVFKYMAFLSNSIPRRRKEDTFETT